MESPRRVSSDRDPPIELLAKQHRRRVLQYLMQTSTDQATIDELVDYLVDNPATGRGTNSEAIRIQLHHADLPKFADLGVIDYDPRSGDVRYLPDDRIEAAMESLEGD